MTACPFRRVILSLPSVPSIGQIVLDSFNSGSDVVQRAAVNLKRSNGYTVGGGLKVVRQGIFDPKSIWTVRSIVTDEAIAVQYRDLIYLQQNAPYIGQVVLTDQDTSINARETAWGTRSIVAGSTVTVGGIARSEIAARVFLETAGTDSDIIRPTSRGGWVIEFTATEV